MYLPPLGCSKIRYTTAPELPKVSVRIGPSGFSLRYGLPDQGGNLQQRSRLGVGGQGLGGQRGDLFLHLVVVDNAIHLHAQPGKPFLELR